MRSQGPWVRRVCCMNWGRLLLLLLLHRERGQHHRGPVLLEGLGGSALLQQLAQLMDAGSVVAVKLLREGLVLLLQALKSGCLVSLHCRLQRCDPGVHSCAKV